MKSYTLCRQLSPTSAQPIVGVAFGVLTDIYPAPMVHYDRKVA
ncbi:MAG: hypothetical protein R3A44_10770 [Caldilineaceae bacterium]